MLDLDTIMHDLAARRPVFHSEADFQHALAWQLQRAIPDARIRLEYKPFASEPIHLDIWTDSAEGAIAVELKYATRQLSVEIVDERFTLVSQAAQPLTRYDFIKDIARLERIVAARPGAAGAAIMLTNNPAMWSESQRADTIGAEFRLQQGQQLTGSRSWTPHAGPGTIVKREKPLTLDGVYRLNWRDYSTVTGQTTSTFRYLLVCVPPGGMIS